MPKTRISISRISSMTTDEESGPDSVSSSRRPSKINHESIRTSNQWKEDKIKSDHASITSTYKSSYSVGYRYA